jgi:hypothetical protein
MPTISNLSSLTNITGTLIFPVVDLTSTIPNKRATLQQLKGWIEGNATVASVAGRIGDVILTYQDIGGLSTVANTGNFNDLIGRPNTFPVVTATSIILGGVRVGKNINVTTSGTITLNTATTNNIGLVKIGTGINVEQDGTISTVPISPATVADGLTVNNGILYVNTASTSTFGGVVVGSGLNVDELGTINVNTATTTTSGAVVVGDGLYLNNIATVNLTTASSTVLGGIKAGYGISITSDGVMTVTTGNFALQAATTASIGGVKIGDNINVDNNGTISVSGRFTSTFIVLNQGQPNDNYITGGTGSTYQTAGIVVGRGTGTSVVFVYTDDYYISTGTAGTVRGIWKLQQVSGTSTYGSGLVVDNIRVSTTATELNIFGYNNSNTAVISVRGTTNYEDRVTQDFHIPNKKYVDNKFATTATTTTVGTVRLGVGITAYGNGTISVLTATTNVLGLVRVGTGLSIGVGTGILSITTATTSTIGGVRSGWPSPFGISIDNSNSTNTGIIALITATTTAIGGVKVGVGHTMNAAGALDLSPASSSALGGVTAGANMSVTAGGALTFAGGTVLNSVYFSNATNATSTSTGTLVVQGGVGITGDLYIGGNITANKLTIQYTTITTTLVQTDDVIKTDNTTQATSTTTGALQVTGGVGIGGQVFIGGNSSIAGITTVTNTTNATSTNTGALQVTGGVGVGGNAFVGGALTATGIIYQGLWSVVTATFSTSTLIALAVSSTQIQTTAQTINAVYYPTFVDSNNSTAISKSIYTTSSFSINPNNGNVSIAGITTVTNITNATSTNTGALQVVGGVGIGGQIFIGGNSSIAGITTVTNITNATSTNTGALQVVGGVGVGGNLRVGGTGTQIGNFFSNFGVAAVNFSNTPVYTTSTTISDSRAVVGATVILTPSATTGTNILGGDELEMDNFTVAASVTTNGIINLYITALPGPVIGQRNFNYILG